MLLSDFWSSFQFSDISVIQNWIGFQMFSVNRHSEFEQVKVNYLDISCYSDVRYSDPHWEKIQILNAHLQKTFEHQTIQMVHYPEFQMPGTMVLGIWIGDL